MDECTGAHAPVTVGILASVNRHRREGGAEGGTGLANLENYLRAEARSETIRASCEPGRYDERGMKKHYRRYSSLV